jgi:hypothetical protein
MSKKPPPTPTSTAPKTVLGSDKQTWNIDYVPDTITVDPKFAKYLPNSHPQKIQYIKARKKAAENLRKKQEEENKKKSAQNSQETEKIQPENNNQNAVNSNDDSTNSFWNSTVSKISQIFSISNSEKSKEPQKVADAGEDGNTNKEKDRDIFNVENYFFRLNKLLDKPPLFTKSYYGADFLSPYIRCFILNKKYDQSNSLQKKLYQNNFFDIPYNLVKDLEIEYPAGDGIGTFTLKLEDTTGLIGTILVATFYAVGAVQDNDGVPKISIEFGWAEKGYKRLRPKDEKNFFRVNTETRFTILDVDLTFTDKGKQEILIKGKNDKVISIVTDDGLEGSPYKPQSVLGSYPTQNIRLIQYYYYFQAKKNAQEQEIKNNKNYQQMTNPAVLINFGLDIFPAFKKGTNHTQIDMKTAVQNFLNTAAKNVNEKYNKDNILLSLSGANFLSDKEADIFMRDVKGDQQFIKTFFNIINPMSIVPEIDDMKTIFNKNLIKAVYNPYLVFCYILNQYIETIKQITKYDTIINGNSAKKSIPIYVLRFYDESKIDKAGLLLDDKDGNISDFCVRDVSLGTDKDKSCGKNVVNSESLKIKENETWESLLKRVAEKVKFNNGNGPKTQSHLFVTANRYTDGLNNDEQLRNQKGVIKTKSRSNFINRLKSLAKAYKNKTDDNSVKQVAELIKKVSEVNDFVYIIITAENEFLSGENFSDKVIAQTYTIYPKYGSEGTRLEFQNFNTGSKKLQKGSFPDVISFSPKLPFQSIIASNLSNEKNMNINFINGAFEFSLKNLTIEFISKDNEKNQKSLEEIIIYLKQIFNQKNKGKISVSYNQAKDSHFLSNYSNVLFKYEMFETYKNDFSLDFSNNTSPEYLVFLTGLISAFEQYYKTLIRGYHYTTLLRTIKKAFSVSPGDSGTINYYNYVNSANEYNKMLSLMGKAFDAELKILGEPAFTKQWGVVLHVFIYVNNADGSPNYLLSGLYSITKIKHDITNGSFTTTLSLKYDSPFSGE